jgi:hypothetical protein
VRPGPNREEVIPIGRANRAFRKSRGAFDANDLLALSNGADFTSRRLATLPTRSTLHSVILTMIIAGHIHPLGLWSSEPTTRR